MPVRDEPAAPGTASNEEHTVIFQLGAEQYALAIEAVQEIVRMQGITSVPGAEPWVVGITNLRGRVVPVVDLRVRCGLAVAERTSATRIIVVLSEYGTVGLMVDAVIEVVRIPGDCIELPGRIAGLPGQTFVRGIAKLPDRLVSLLDLDGVLSGQDALVATAPEAETDRAAA